MAFHFNRHDCICSRDT